MNLNDTNVLIMSNTYFPFSLSGGKKYSGVDQVAELQYNLLKKVCKSVKVICTKDSFDEKGGDDIVYYEFYSKLYMKNNGRNNHQRLTQDFLFNIIDRNNINLILYNITKNRNIIEYLTDISNKYKIPVIFYNHSLTEEGRIAWERNLGYRYAVDHNCVVVSPTKYSRDIINKQVNGCCNHNTLYMYMPENIYPLISKERNGKIISASRIAPEMKLAQFAIAFKKSGRECEIYGNTNPEYEEFYNDNVKPYLNDKVLYKGNIPHSDLMRIFCQSSLLCHSRDCESASLIIPEALACGVPCLILDTNYGAKDTVREIGIECDDLIVNTRRLGKERASEIIKDKIEYFFSSKYNTDEYRDYISKTTREFFNTENSF